MIRKTSTLALGALVLLAMAAAADADMLLLKDGRIIERPNMERVEGGVKVVFENGEIVVPAVYIEAEILENAPLPAAKTPEEQAKMDKGLVPFEGKWIKPGKRASLIQKRIAKRKADLADVKEHMLWRKRWKQKTKHFEFEYTVPPSVAEYYRDLMEAYYKAFAKDWKVGQPKNLGRLKVCFYINRQDFQQIGGAGRGTLAYFKFVEPLELNFFYDRLDPDLTEQVMYHEANHYLQYLLNPEFNMPHFPSEALAEYYGASVYNPKTKKLETGQVLEGRLTEIQLDVLNGKMMGLEKMLTREMYEHYNWGWSLAHFLMNDKRYRKRFERFVKELASGKGVKHVPYAFGLKTVKMPQVWEHFKRTLGLKNAEDVTELETEWHEYVKKGLKVVTSRGLEKAATRAMNAGRDIRAKRLFKEAIEKGTDSAMAYHHYAGLLERKSGSRGEAVKYHKKAIELAPLEPSLYVSLARALRFGDDKEEGVRLLKLALELDPDNPLLEREIKNATEDDD